MTTESGSNQRTAIFDAIRDSGLTVECDEEGIRREAAELAAGVVDARPPLLADDIVDAFRMRFDSGLVVGSTCSEIEDLRDLPAAVSHYLEKHGLPFLAKIQPADDLTGLDWTGFDTDADVELDDSVAVLKAEFGIAETGSVVVCSSASMPVLLNFLPLHAIVVVARSRILPFLDDYAAIAGEMAGDSGMPRNVSLITGASGTTDIEGVLVKGAHGPKFLHVVVVSRLSEL